MRHRPLAFLVPLVLLLPACRTAAPAAWPGRGGLPPSHPPITAPMASPVAAAHGEAVEGRDFLVYRGDGTPSSLRALVDSMAWADAVLVGEEHDDVAGHRVQRQILERAWAVHHVEGGRPVLLSLEMFERDVQGVVDEYLSGLITEEHFLASARPWSNYERDYRPLVELARAHDIPVLAANAPRRYVNLVSRLGRDSLRALPEAALQSLPPLPYPEPSERYVAQWDSLMGDAASHMAGSALDAQALWDAAMGHAVARALGARPGALVVHMAGGFHVDRGTGIPEALQHYRPGTNDLLVAIRAVDDPRAFDPVEHAGRGDWVVLTDSGWKAPRSPH